MAEPTLSMTFKDLYEEVGFYLYQSYTLTDSQKTTAQRYVNIGYSEFLLERKWSFLLPESELSVTEDDESTDLPDNFGRIADGRIYHDAAMSEVCAVECSASYLRSLRTASNELTGTPTHFAIVPKTPAATGQRYEVMWHPIPDEDMTFYWTHEVRPNKLSSDGDYPVGGLHHDATLLAASLRVAERMSGRTQGVHANHYERMLARSIERDKDASTQTRRKDIGAPIGFYDSISRISGDVTH